MAFIKTHQRSNTVFGVLRSDNDGIGKTIPLVQALIPYRYRLPEIVELGRRMDLRDADATNITVDKKNKVVTGVKKVTFETKALLRIIDDTEGTGIDLVVPLKKTTLSFWRIRALETAPFKTGKEPLIHFEAYRDSINQRITPEQVASLRRPVRDEESVHAPSNTAPAQPVPAAPYENQAATVEGVVSTNTATLSAASNQPIISSEDRGTSTEEVDIPFSQEPVTTVEEGIYCTLGQATLPTATNQAIFSPTNLTGQVATIEGVEGTISKYITTLVEELGSSLVEATGPIFTSQLALPTEVAEDDTLEAQVAILEQVQSSPLQVVITTVEQVDSSTLQTLLTTENQVDLPAITQVTTTITSKPSDIPSPVIENQALLAHSEPNHPSNQGFKACPVGHSSSYSFDEEDLLVDDLAQTVKHPPTTAQLPVDLTLDYHSTNELSFLQALAYPSIEALTGETAIAQVSEGTLRNITQPPEDSLTEKVPPLAQTRRSQSLRKFVELHKMEPRARVGKNRGQQNFSDQELQHFLFAHGDHPHSLDLTKKVLDELLTDFITETCFEAHRSAQLAGRQKIKLDDIKFACRKNPLYLGKIQETLDKKAEIDAARKLLDQNDDKITKSNVKALEEEPLNDADDDLDLELKVGSRSTSVGTRR